MTYRTYFDKDTGAYLGSYGGSDTQEANPFFGHKSVNGQLDGNRKLVGGAVVPLPPVARAPELDEQLAALWALAERDGLTADGSAAPGSPEEVLDRIERAKMGRRE